ncbi:MAG: ATP-binding protein, partial [Olivibacter sp.]|nr:ATP-binding protein [Olivibacter sp. UJ_SKK_5.1]
MRTLFSNKARFGFYTVIFLVLVLASIIILHFFTNRPSNKLQGIVSELAYNDSYKEKIERAINLLYEAELNAGLYVFTHDQMPYEDYLSNMKEIELLVDSLFINYGSELRMSTLLSDKKEKTELFIRFKFLADSLLSNLTNQYKAGAGDTQYRQIYKTKRPLNSPILQQEVDTTFQEETILKKNTKGLFGRIRDAIINKPSEEKTRNRTIIEKGSLNAQVFSDADSVVLKSIPSKVALHEKETDLTSIMKLTNKKGQEALEANAALFSELRELLEIIKYNKISYTQKHQLVLSQQATSEIDTIQGTSLISIVLCVLLTGVILVILSLLYRNDQKLEEAKMQAEQYAKMKSDFVAVMSHEIRTPLHAIGAFTDQLTEKGNNIENAEVVNALKLSSSMLLSVVNNILDLTKIEEGKFILKEEIFSPAKIIEAIEKGLSVQAKQKNIELTSNIAITSDINLIGDAFRLKQILLNIIGNAIKYTQKGLIEVNAKLQLLSTNDALLHLEINDTGIGIAAQELPFIFEKFTTGQHNSAITEASTGLGLNIVKKIVDYHNGKIYARSTEGKGSTFIVELPYKVAPALTTNVPPVNQSNTTILIVEDDLISQVQMAKMLEKAGFKVMKARDVNAGLNQLTGISTHLLITDIHLEGANGLDFVKKVRAMPTYKEIPIIVTSGFDYDEWAVQCETLKINGYLAKPFQADQLLHLVESILHLQ